MDTLIGGKGLMNAILRMEIEIEARVKAAINGNRIKTGGPILTGISISHPSDLFTTLARLKIESPECFTTVLKEISDIMKSTAGEFECGDGEALIFTSLSARFNAMSENGSIS